MLGYNAGLGNSVQATTATMTNVHSNVGVGSYTLYQLGAGMNNSVAIGHAAGQNTTGSYNTFVGAEAGKGGTTSAPFSSGQLNTFIGKDAGKGFTTGGYNNALGAEALDALTTGAENQAMGVGALGVLTTQNSNVAIGGYAGSSIAGSDAIDNVIIGGYAGTGGRGALKRSIAILEPA
jgi:hypothetical protein